MSSISPTMTAFHLTAVEWLLLDVLAVARLVRLVTKDTITERFRHWVLNHVGTGAFDFLTCPWCTSVWIAAVVVVLTVYVPDEWRFVAYALTCSVVASLLIERS